MNTHDIILKPIISEKSMNGVKSGKFSFAVNRLADKRMIVQAIQSTFHVHIVSIATAIVKGKSRRIGTRRTEKKQSVWKRAIVELKKGEKIGLFEAGSQEV